MKVNYMLEKASTFVATLLDGEDQQAQEALVEMECLSESSSMFYPYLSIFQAMMDANKPTTRIRGFRMYCAIAKWDKKSRIELGFLNTLSILQDEYAENVIQALEALYELIPYKRHLLHYIEFMLGRIIIKNEDMQKTFQNLQQYIQLVKSFDVGVDRRQSNAVKWQGNENLHAMWVADMEFACAPEIYEALKERLHHAVFGYDIVNKDYYLSVVNWWKKRYQTTLKEDHIVFAQGVIPALSSLIRTFTKENDLILVQEPVYHTFRKTIEKNQRKVISSDLIYKNYRYSIDFKDLEEKLSMHQVKMMILCNPHNPIGKLWNKEEIATIAKLCKENDVLLISDEIHCDLTRMHKNYIPAASLEEELSKDIISLYSVTKTFNLAGLHASCIYCPNEDMLKKIRKGIYRDDVGSTNAFGAIAATAAYQHGERWLKLLRIYLDDNLKYMDQYLQKNLPSIKMIQCDATYLAWLDVSAHTDDIDDFCQHLYQNHDLLVSNGGEFKKGECFLRVNVAAPRSHIEKGLKRLQAAIQSYQK